MTRIIFLPCVWSIEFHSSGVDPANQSSSKRISNRQLPIDGLSVLQIFRVKRLAARLQGSGDYKRIVNTVPVLFCNSHRPVVGIKRDWNWVGAQNANEVQRLFYFFPRHTQLATRDRGKFIQRLNTYDAAARE